MNDFGLSVVFNALIVSKMLYASPVFGGYLHLDELDSLQRR
jgi:hypothetical protein